MKNQKNCILIPAYNAEKTIYNIVHQAKKVISDIIVIDDGSNDNTITESLRAGAHLIINKKNSGKGFALKRGITYATEHNFDNIITMDADGQHDPKEISSLLNALKNHDLIIGRRCINKSKQMPILINLFNYTISLLISLIIKNRLYDTQSGFRTFKLNSLKKLNLKSNHYEIETEMILKASFLKMRIDEIPVKTIYHKRLPRYTCLKDFFDVFFLLLSPKIYGLNLITVNEKTTQNA